MGMMDLDAFLTRIGYTGSRGPTQDTLRRLHRAFVMAVPFENLDIHLGRRIVLDEEAFFRKIVGEGRGGFCYELNGLFAAVLRELGFDVTLFSARVFDGNGEMGREFVHLMLLVTLEKRWIADVGFGDWTAEPLWLDTEDVQAIDRQSFRVTRNGERYVVEKKDESEGCWKQRYSFALTPRRLSEFSAMCEDLQTAEDSFFRRRRMCTRCTPEGRVTLTEEKLIITADGVRREIELQDEGAYRRALGEQFRIVLRGGRFK
jgi:N-hydroxyarylamine O-acetyltransferase